MQGFANYFSSMNVSGITGVDFGLQSMLTRVIVETGTVYVTFSSTVASTGDIRLTTGAESPLTVELGPITGMGITATSTASGCRVIAIGSRAR